MNSMTSIIIVLIAVLFVWHKLWKDYALDKLRDDLFTIRNDLFDIVHNNEDLSFNGKLYINFENILNNTIRSGNQLSFSGVVIFSILLKIFYPKKVITSNIERAYENMDKDITNKKLKKRIGQLKKRYESSIIKYLLRTSLTFLLITSMCFVFITLQMFFKKAKRFTISYAKNQTKERMGELLNDIEIQVEAFA